ncbi:VWA domain-containing protein [Methanofollis formosanus]|uniref:VWA domain-containing protein n=1 Tax=Methanofollis formosanus TaxID=299308 RepID=A0A8G1EGN5_9EURY|nr:Ig-like domain-containing protein [Methanofollis formosanus]QYZ79112.1 VWA domain-containing protein [Methanofollis formosanus]
MVDRSYHECLFIFLGLLIICMTVTASENLQLSVDTGSEWVVGGGTGGVVVTAWVNNSDGSPLKGADVVFSCNTTMGSFSRTTGQTDEDGRAMTTFLPGKKSGTALINVTASSDEGHTVNRSCEQQIDHAEPYRLRSFECKNEVPAGSTTEIVLSMEDEYGNLIDARNEIENVTFYVGSPGDRAHFGNGEKEIVVPVDGSGVVSVGLTIDTKAGENIVYIDLPEGIKDEYLTIIGTGDEMPYELTGEVDSDWVPANGKDLFTITYTVLDQHKNPCNGTEIAISTSLGENEGQTVLTNRAGRATITYGPRNTVGKVTITATTLQNENLIDTQVVEFTSTAPVRMVLTASPRMMPSGDVPNAKPARVMAKVVDMKGYPVAGEKVTFTIKSPHGDAQIEPPYWASPAGDNTTEAFTDEQGYAVALLYPGSFEVGEYSPARAGCTVGAVWDSYPEQTVDLEWTNVPYLSVLTNVTPPKAAWNDTVEVDITLIGNGYKLQRKPVDVVLVMDKSVSMRYRDNNGNIVLSLSKSRLNEAQNSAKDFVNQMDLECGRGRVGLIVMNEFAKKAQSLTNDSQKINADIDDLAPIPSFSLTVLLNMAKDVLDGKTNMRDSLKLAIDELNSSGRPDAVKAVVLISDGKWNINGNPLAQGIGWTEEYDFSKYYFEDEDYHYYSDIKGEETLSYSFEGQWCKGDKKYLRYHRYDRPSRFIYGDTYWVPDIPSKNDTTRGKIACYDGQFTNQNMSVYAANNDVILYTIGFASTDLTEMEPYMVTLSESTGGRYTWAKNETELKKVYSEIAGELWIEAGVNTSLALDFTDVTVSTNTSVLTAAGDEVFEYIPETHEKMVWFNEDSVEGYPKSRNDAENWTKGRLDFDIGTIKLNQTWQATFKLKVRPNPDAIGNVKILDENSILTFNEADTLRVPDTYLTVMRSLNNVPLGDASLTLDGLRETGITRQTMDIAWNLTYTGNSTVTETVEYRAEHGSWALAETRTAGKGETHERARLDIRDLPLTTYYIRVVADTDDAGSRHCIMQVDLGALLNDKTYLKIE